MLRVQIVVDYPLVRRFPEINIHSLLVLVVVPVSHLIPAGANSRKLRDGCLGEGETTQAEDMLYSSEFATPDHNEGTGGV